MRQFIFAMLFFISVSAMSETLGKNSQWDRFQVSDLIQEYALIVSSRDVSRYPNLRTMYAPGGVFEGLKTFLIDSEFDEYVDYLVSLGDGDIPNLRQFLGNSSVEVMGSSALAVTPVLLLSTTENRITIIVAVGELHDSLVMTKDGWKFELRRAVIDGSATD